MTMSALHRSTSMRLLVLGLLLAGFALRVFRLDAQSLWYDEGVTAWVAQMTPADAIAWTADDIQPPLYYLTMAVWGRLAGWSEWSLRFPAAWWGLLVLPLLAAVTLRLTRRPTAAVVAVLLAAVHPLLVYYSQEARMYAMLTALAVLAGYLTIRHADRPDERRTLVFYVLTALAAVYTHYFAFFLLLALGVAYLGDAARSGGRGAHWLGRVRGFALANVVVLLGYLPWLWVMLRRLAVDNSYWQGSLKLNEALRHVLISFTSGETMREATALWLLLGFALVTALAVVRLWRAGSAGRRTLLYGLTWLLIPVAATLALAAFAPKFNPRYVMAALPGLVVVWGGGVASKARLKIEDWEDERSGPTAGVALSTQSPPRVSSQSHTPRRFPIFNLQSSITALALLFLLSTSLFSLGNWFVDPAFRKDQWRELTADLRQRVGPEEAIVLVSGHAWPVWHYYAPDLPVVRLPDIDVLDVDAVLDFADTAGPLRAALDPLSDRPGAWLVGWQDDVVDPMHVVPAQLELAGREKGMDSRYWGIDLRRFSQLKTNWIPDAPPIDVPLDATFGDAVRLVGYNTLDNGDLLLFWQLLPGGADADLSVAVTTLDAAGNTVAALPPRRLAGYVYPTFRWSPGRTGVTYLAAADWLGPEPQPGEHTFRLQVSAAAQPRRPLPLADGTDTLTVGPIEVVID